MAELTREDLMGEYAWTDCTPDDPKVSGVPDHTHFNPGEGYEVLYLINTLTREWDLRNIRSGHKMERMLRDLPADIRSQAEVKQWIKKKWASYKFKEEWDQKKEPKDERSQERREERGPESQACMPLPTGSACDRTRIGQDIHFCFHCTSVTESIQLPVSHADLSPVPEFPGIHHFKRRRQCQVCKREFETVEVNSSLLHELVRLRALVNKIKSELDASDR